MKYLCDAKYDKRLMIKKENEYCSLIWRKDSEYNVWEK